MSKANELESSKKMMGQMVIVDAKKLGQGLKTTFEGMAMVFDSIGVEGNFDVEGKHKKKSSVKESADKAPILNADPDEKAVPEENEENKGVADTIGVNDAAVTAVAEASADTEVEKQEPSVIPVMSS